MQIPWIVSVDDHVVEPPHLWQSRVPGRLKDIAPKVVVLPNDAWLWKERGWVRNDDPVGPPAAFWQFDGQHHPISKTLAAAGFPAEEVDNTPLLFEEMRPGCYEPRARVQDMEMSGVEASLCFPNYSRFCGQMLSECSDRELALACVRAYNDWMVEEWHGESDGRLIPLCIVPLWDAELAAAEVARNAARGVRAVAFSEVPPWLGLESIHSGYWDPLFRACSETDTVVCMHIGSGSRTVSTSADAPDIMGPVLQFTNSATSMLEFLVSGVMAKFPKLNLLYAECQIGWIPYLLERADDAWRTHLWSHDGATEDLPSSYYYDRVFSCFFRDPVGVRLLDQVGVNQVMFETDYPHQDTTWPHTVDVVKEMLAGLDDSVVHRVLRGNAIDLFGLKLRSR